MDKFITKTSYYVEYLGWKPTKGLQGRMYTEPIIRELLGRQKDKQLPKITIQLNRKDMKISRETLEEGKKKKIKCIKYPPIPTRDIVFAIQGLDPHCDVVACVFLGFNPRTQRYVHAHIYRFDAPQTAANFVHYIQTLASTPDNLERIRKIESELIAKKQIEQPRDDSEPTNNFDASLESFAYHSENETTDFKAILRPVKNTVEDDLVSLNEVTPFDSITDELKHRLAFGAAPLLLPPKDYDTICRAQGNVEEAGRRKCLNISIVGENGTISRTPSDSQTADSKIKSENDVPNLSNKRIPDALQTVSPSLPSNPVSIVSNENLSSVGCNSPDYKFPSPPSFKSDSGDGRDKDTTSSSDSFRSHSSGNDNALSDSYREPSNTYTKNDNVLCDSYREPSNTYTKNKSKFAQQLLEEINKINSENNYINNNNVITKDTTETLYSTIEEPAADYDLDEEENSEDDVILRQPSQNVSRGNSSNIFEHAFFRNSDHFFYTQDSHFTNSNSSPTNPTSVRRTNSMHR